MTELFCEVSGHERTHLKLESVCKDVVNRCGAALRTARIGSAYINRYEPESFGDYDVLVQVPSSMRTASRISGCSGWSLDGKYGPAGDFCSLRCETYPDLNLILVDDSDLFDNWVSAAEVCKFIAILEPKLSTKDVRVAVHRIVMDKMNVDGSTRDD